MYTPQSRFSRVPRGGSRNSRPAHKKQNIHPSKFIKEAKAVEQIEYISKNTFEDFAFNPVIERNLKDKGYLTPTPIQDQSIPHIMQGKDLVGLANTGTGKTAAFVLPILHRIIDNRKLRALIIAPTRELATQIEEELRSFAKGSGLRAALLIGGASMGKQIGELRGNPHFIIGTPGRMKDHVQRGTLKLDSLNVVVLDEVDRMLDMGFVADIRTLLTGMSPVRQSLFFSATMDPKISTLIKTFSQDPVQVSVKIGETSENVNQDVVYYLSTDDKIEKLHNLLIQPQVGKTLVFDDTKHGVERLGRELAGRGFRVDALHGNKSQAQRQRALDRFKSSEVTVLVATDVAARGIDVADITHVINYSAPTTYDDYIHRIGRAGRAGKSGSALTFLSR